MSDTRTSNSLLPCPFCAQDSTVALVKSDAEDFVTVRFGLSWYVCCDVNKGGCGDLPDAERAFSREKTAAIIHAALWAHSARSGSTASAYAINSLFEAIGLETWTFKKRPTQETPVRQCTCVTIDERNNCSCNSAQNR